MTGTGLGAILFGPAAVSVLGLIVLVFQAILLAHGGLTTLGANTFSMAIAGPLVSFGLYKLCLKFKLNRKVAIFLAAFLGDLFTLRHELSAGAGLPVRSRRRGRLGSEIPRRIRPHTAAAGHYRRHTHSDHCHGSGILCQTGIESHWIFKGG